jgi:hypothetical protein
MIQYNLDMQYWFRCHVESCAMWLTLYKLAYCAMASSFIIKYNIILVMCNCFPLDIRAYYLRTHFV